MALVNVIFVSFVLLFLKSIAGFKIPITKYEGVHDIVDCASKILLKYYTRGGEVTFIDMHDNSNINYGVLAEMHRRLHVSIIYRTLEAPLYNENDGYVIYVRTALDFVGHFKCLTREGSWNPHARFMIVMDLKKIHLKTIFKTLLKYHVFNVVVINGIHNSTLYSYKPFDNYGCGKRFDRIIDYGKCKDSLQVNLFPNILVSGIQNCTLNVAAPHWPPYIINPSTNISKRFGIEQFVFEIISKIEQFKVNYTYTNNAENFTVINQEMSAVGPLDLLQTNKADAIFGGMILIKDRADAFDYIYSHLANVDEIKLLVKKAGIVKPWKNIYLEFQPVVWTLLAVSFILYFLFLILIIRGHDNTSVMLKMWDSLFAHGSIIRNNRAAKFAFIIWVWFAYLVNSVYQSNLFSLCTHPAKDYQISSDQDLADYHLKPCVSKVIQTLMWAELGMPMSNSTDNCELLLQSIRTVTKEDNFYTITLYSIYSYNRHNFVDSFGDSLLYEFPTLNKIMYAIYFYKGFPLLHKFHTYTLRLRENGLIEKVAKDLDYEESIRHYYSKDSKRFRTEVPWFIYLFGTSLATVIFAIELVQTSRSLTGSIIVPLP
ncbi:uncharacterized protein LOC128676249 [Plodia interpunctella]|uniref:uncharacterized protein LOC128676249 n=1 Tax=Plodia interpunctella TaxID=58824 RepID=UPI002368D77F|nr:uncharacterized protein LOC128676249 [Plodia interpunctella]